MTHGVPTCLLTRLKEAGMEHVFGCLAINKLSLTHCILESGQELVSTGDELNTGYATDAYV